MSSWQITYPLVKVLLMRSEMTDSLELSTCAIYKLHGFCIIFQFFSLLYRIFHSYYGEAMYDDLVPFEKSQILTNGILNCCLGVNWFRVFSSGQKVLCCILVKSKRKEAVKVWTKGSCLSSESWRKEAVFHLSLDERKLSFVWVWTKGSCLLSSTQTMFSDFLKHDFLSVWVGKLRQLVLEKHFTQIFDTL